MGTLEFFQSFISPSCYKIDHNTTELRMIKQIQGVLQVKATTLYQIYKHNVYEMDGRLTVRDFYRVAGQYLYYDKYVCDHGTEFYYYVVFNADNEMYQLTQGLIRKRIAANNPSTLKDLVHVVEAVSKEE